MLAQSLRALEHQGVAERPRHEGSHHEENGVGAPPGGSREPPCGASRSGGWHLRPQQPYSEVGANWCTGLAPRMSGANRWDARKQHCGGHRSDNAAKHRHERETALKKQGCSGEIAPPRRDGESSACRQTQAFTGPGRATPRGQTPSASPRAHRHALMTTLALIRPRLDSRPHRICLGIRPGPIGTCTHGVIVELALLALEHAEDADAHGLAPAGAIGGNRDSVPAVRSFDEQPWRHRPSCGRGPVENHRHLGSPGKAQHAQHHASKEPSTPSTPGPTLAYAAHLAQPAPRSPNPRHCSIWLDRSP
jgi:hypothetical protein